MGIARVVGGLGRGMAKGAREEIRDVVQDAKTALTDPRQAVRNLVEGTRMQDLLERLDPEKGSKNGN
jgi:hypothetical protein